jgi:hypothetical protein
VREGLEVRRLCDSGLLDQRLERASASGNVVDTPEWTVLCEVRHWHLCDLAFWIRWLRERRWGCYTLFKRR